MDWKEKGNKAFQEGKFKEARELYTQGIAADRSLAVLWSNRAAASFALKEFEISLSDAMVAISLQPSFVKVLISIPLPPITYSRLSGPFTQS